MSNEDIQPSQNGTEDVPSKNKMTARYNLSKHKSKDISQLNYHCEYILFN